MARFGMCSLIEANQIDFSKILYYQDKIIAQLETKQESDKPPEFIDNTAQEFL